VAHPPARRAGRQNGRIARTHAGCGAPRNLRSTRHTEAGS
jgi:hypothetical protein